MHSSSLTRVSNVDFTEFCNEFEVSLTTNKDGFLQSKSKPLRYRYRVHTIARDWDPMAVTRLGVQFDKSKYWNCILEIA